MLFSKITYFILIVMLIVIIQKNTWLIIYWGNKLYFIHPLNLAEDNRPKTGQSDVSTVYRFNR